VLFASGGIEAADELVSIDQALLGHDKLDTTTGMIARIESPLDLLSQPRKKTTKSLARSSTRARKSRRWRNRWRAGHRTSSPASLFTATCEIEKPRPCKSSAMARSDLPERRSLRMRAMALC
jgi:hypothetical protein